MKSEKEILLKHLGPVLKTEMGYEYSAFKGVLNDARLATGRRLEDGRLMPDFTGIKIIWLCVPELIGLRGKSFVSQNLKSCTKPLSAFSSITSSSI